MLLSTYTNQLYFSSVYSKLVHKSFLQKVITQNNNLIYDKIYTLIKTLFYPILYCTLQIDLKETLFFSRNIKCYEHETRVQKNYNSTMY